MTTSLDGQKDPVKESLDDLMIEDQDTQVLMKPSPPMAGTLLPLSGQLFLQVKLTLAECSTPSLVCRRTWTSVS